MVYGRLVHVGSLLSLSQFENLVNPCLQVLFFFFSVSLFFLCRVVCCAGSHWAEATGEKAWKMKNLKRGGRI